jgi:phosphoserine phosphatase RsbU/P
VEHRTLILRPGVKSPGVARKTVLRWLQDVGLEELADNVLLIVSELVANAAVHAQTVLEISMSTTSRSVKLSVSDDDRRFRRPDRTGSPEINSSATAAELPEGGRGLSIVESLADEWGVDLLPSGKRVWARVSSSSP